MSGRAWGRRGAVEGEQASQEGLRGVAVEQAHLDALPAQ